MLTFFDSSFFLFQTSLTPGNWNIFEQRLFESGFIGITLLCCSVGRISLVTRSGTFYLLFCFTFLLFTFVYFAQNCTGTISEDTERQKVIVLLCTLYCSWTMLFFVLLIFLCYWELLEIHKLFQLSVEHEVIVFYF